MKDLWDLFTYGLVSESSFNTFVYACICACPVHNRVKNMRENVKALVREYNKTEDDLKALQVRE